MVPFTYDYARALELVPSVYCWLISVARLGDVLLTFCVSIMSASWHALMSVMEIREYQLVWLAVCSGIKAEYNCGSIMLKSHSSGRGRIVSCCKDDYFKPFCWCRRFSFVLLLSIVCAVLYEAPLRTNAGWCKVNKSSRTSWNWYFDFMIIVNVASSIWHEREF